MPIVTLNTGDVHVQEFNKTAEETIVLIHGMFGNLSLYYFEIAPLLAEKYHVVLYDLKGHGKSTKSYDGYRLDLLADELQALTDQMKLAKFHLIGYSFGGLVALKYTQKYSYKVEKLGVIDSPDLSTLNKGSFAEIYQKEFLKPYFEKYSTENIEVLLEKRPMKKFSSMFNFLANHSTLSVDVACDKDFFYQSNLSGIVKETLLLYGLQSSFYSAGQYLNNTMPFTSFISADGDHSFPMTSPSEVGSVLMKFMNHELIPAGI